MGVDEIDPVVSEKPGEESDRVPGAVLRLVNNRHVDAEPPQFAGQPAVIHQDGRHADIGALNQVPRGRRELHLCAGPQVRGHHVADPGSAPVYPLS